MPSAGSDEMTPSTFAVDWPCLNAKYRFFRGGSQGTVAGPWGISLLEVPLKRRNEIPRWWASDGWRALKPVFALNASDGLAHARLRSTWGWARIVYVEVCRAVDCVVIYYLHKTRLVLSLLWRLTTWGKKKNSKDEEWKKGTVLNSSMQAYKYVLLYVLYPSTHRVQYRRSRPYLDKRLGGSEVKG